MISKETYHFKNLALDWIEQTWKDIFVQEDIKTTIYSPEEDKYPRGYDYLPISDNNNQSYEYAGIFFHENSLKFLKKQKTWRLIDMYKTQKLLNLLKKVFTSLF